MTWPAWKDIPDAHKAVIESALTAKQLEVFQLRGSGYGKSKIAYALGISTQAVEGRLAGCQRKLEQAFKEAA